MRRRRSAAGSGRCALSSKGIGREIVDKNVAEKLRSPKVPLVSKPFVTDEIFEKLPALCPVSTFLGERRQTGYF